MNCSFILTFIFPLMLIILIGIQFLHLKEGKWTQTGTAGVGDKLCMHKGPVIIYDTRICHQHTHKNVLLYQVLIVVIHAELIAGGIEIVNY